ncbi:MAG: flagellar basal body P-ring formation chaperone FlgA [Sedimentisphaerales bacterium]|jgi:flagella basal body P-ring formation protein FlgA
MSTEDNARAKGHTNAKMLISCMVVACAILCQGWAKNTASDAAKDSNLRIYLPRKVAVKDADLLLGKVSVIRGRESLVIKANNIAIGRVSTTSQTVIIDRPTVLSRLASSGIPSAKVVFTGADQTKVTRKQQVVTGREFVAQANSFLKSNPPDTSVCQWIVIRRPQDLVIPETVEEVRFAPRLIRSNMINHMKVEMTVLSGDKKIGARDVVFTVKYNCRQAVTTKDVAKGAVLNRENVKIETKPSNYPEPANWKLPYGLLAKRPLPANTVLQPYMTGSSESPLVVKRNQRVVIRIEQPGFMITAVGIVLQDGKAGDHVRVRNVDSQRIILARVNDDASVEPVL